MKKIIINTILMVLLFKSVLFPQEITQTIKGKVFDVESNVYLPGATVIILGTDPLIGTTTSPDGYFILNNVPVGRINLQISYVGYEDYFINELLVNSGKEIFLEIPLKEKFTSIDEVVIKPEEEKDKASNKMATLSARTFSVEDAQRYAGGMDDPSRLASSFAGVTPNTIDNNEIVIRGNAAKGILWRLEGVEIPAPNHLAGLFSGGGVNTIFNSNMLSNSDFFTGAFPAEYGNALSGVFDINLRSGNFDKHEYALQVGTYGIDFSLEGPFVKGKRSSYLVNYRYSTYGLIQDLLPQVTGLPRYSDLSLHLVSSNKKYGTFSFWSINGIGNIKYQNELDTAKWETNYDSYDYDINYNLTASGINHRKITGEKSYLFSTISFSATEFMNKNTYYRPDLTNIPIFDQNEKDYKLTLASYFNHKFNNRHTNRTGVILSRLSYNYDVSANSNVAYSDTSDSFVKSKDVAYYGQFYSQSKYTLTENLNFKAGIHLMYFNLNKELSIEPRAGINWNFSNNQTLSLAYGKHSKLEPLRIYLMDVPTSQGVEKENKDLKITKAHHFVLEYDLSIGNFTHLKIEPYYQKIYDVPTIPDSSFSMINYNNEMSFSSKLTNTGTGKNYGLDLTLERFMHDGYYFLFTASFYNSKYKGDDGVVRNTKYNQNYVFNILGGNEWQTKKDNTLSLNGKFTILGGKRHAPVNLEESIEKQFVVYDNTKIYEEQSPTNYYLDISINYTINKPKYSHSLILQIKNLLLQKEFLGHAYNYKKNTIEPYELTILFPYLSYKIQF